MVVQAEALAQQEQMQTVLPLLELAVLGLLILFLELQFITLVAVVELLNLELKALVD
jgi:hypothetical protein